METLRLTGEWLAQVSWLGRGSIVILVTAASLLTGPFLHTEPCASHSTHTSHGIHTTSLCGPAVLCSFRRFREAEQLAQGHTARNFFFFDGGKMHNIT